MADNRQRYVTGDTLAFVAVVAGRDIKTICGRAMRRRIDPAYISRETAFIASLPERTRDNLILCRKLHARFLRGDYRMSEPEHARLRDAADWLHRLDRENKGQPDQEPVNWEENRAHRFQETPMPPGTYEQLLGMVASGELDRIAGA